VKLMATGSKTCCPFHGFLEVGVCDGTDKTGDEVVFSNVPVCVKHAEETEVKPALECPLHCELVDDFLNLDAEPIKDGVLTHKNKEYHNFCLGLKCDNNGERFHPWFEACGECISDDMNRKLSERTGVPNCCGLNDTLNRESKECSMEPTNLDFEQMTKSCNRRNKQTLQLITDPAKLTDDDTICVQVLGDGTEAGLVCDHDCQGHEDCVQSCMGVDKGRIEAIDFHENQRLTLGPDFDLKDKLGVSTVLFGKFHECPEHIANHTYLYPDWTCDEKVNFGQNGSLSWKSPDTDGHWIQLDYGEFCIDPLGGDLRRGEYRIKTCKEKIHKTSKTEVKKNTIYYTIVLCISIVCLATTMFIYGFFRKALLKTEYNQVMMNFAGMLLLAFLTLVLQTNLKGDLMTKTTCTVLSLINQFSILAAFSLMTLMSYSISRQIFNFVIENKQRRFMRRLAITYTIPSLITLITMIVELAAPRCASARPKFGMRTCHFYGDVAKFIFFLLPILLLLIANSIMFCFIAYNLYKNHTSAKRGGHRSKKMDQMVIFVRLFLGMGITWYFEILVFALSNHNVHPNVFIFTDTLNMCQGVWVFLIFVCKRNVYGVMTGQARGLYNTVRHTVRSLSRQVTGSTNPTSKLSFPSKLKREESNTSTFTRDISLTTGSVPEAHQMSYANLKDKEDQKITEE